MPDIKLLTNLIALMSKLIVLFPDVADVSKLSTEFAKERLQNEKTSYRMTLSLKAGGRQEKNLLSFIFERVTK